MVKIKTTIKDKYSIISVDAKIMKEWFLKKHYAHRLPSISYCFALLNKEKQVVWVCSFWKPASPSLCVWVCWDDYSKYVYELNRLCTNDWLPKNSLSYFVSTCLKLLPPLIIVSYSDTKYNHHWYIYQATNRIYTGKTVERTDIWMEDGTHSRHYDKNIDYSKNRKHRSSKHRYIYVTWCNRRKRKINNLIKYKKQAYPKWKNKKYDASYKPVVQSALF